MHCNLTHDKTYFEVCSFILCVVECLCFRFIILLLGVVLPDVVSLAFAADEELLVFVIVFDLVTGLLVTVFVVVVFDVFCVDCAEPIIANAPTRRKLRNAFFMIAILYYKVNLYSKSFLVVNSQLTVEWTRAFAL